MADPQCEQDVAAGWALLRAGNARGAALRFKAALKIDVAHPNALGGLAQSQLNLGQIADADETSSSLLSAAPNLAMAHRLRAQVLRLQKKYPKAVAAARQAVSLAPREPFGYHILAAVHTSRKDRRAAIKACEEGLAAAPASAILRAQMADNLLDTRGAKAAVPFADEALRLAPDDRYVQRVAARVALGRNQLERARDLLSAMLRRNANDEDAISLYLLSDPKRYRVLRGAFQFGVWRRSHGLLGRTAAVAAIALAVAVLLVVIMVTKIPGAAVGVGIQAGLRAQRMAHRREVKAHFKTYALDKSY